MKMNLRWAMGPANDQFGPIAPPLATTSGFIAHANASRNISPAANNYTEVHSHRVGNLWLIISKSRRHSLGIGVFIVDFKVEKILLLSTIYCI